MILFFLKYLYLDLLRGKTNVFMCLLPLVRRLESGFRFSVKIDTITFSDFLYGDGNRQGWRFKA